MNTIQTATKYATIDRLRQTQNGNTPRFEAANQFGGFLSWLKISELNEPPYKPDSRIRDAWLQGFARAESFTTGVINSVTLIDANRGWAITGGRNLVRKWTSKLHNSASGKGWRYFCKKTSLSFWTTDMNAVVGTRRESPWAVAQRDGDGVLVTRSPLISFENIDPAQCRLASPGQLSIPEEIGFEMEYELLYKDIPLFPWDYFRVPSMPSDSEIYNGLGYCALSRSLRLSQLLYAIYLYDMEKLSGQMMKGLLLLHNITETQWEQAMTARKEKLSSLERQLYGGMQVLCSDGEEAMPDAKVVALSQLPDGFDQETMTHLLMNGIATCFGYSVEEFFRIPGGSFGQGKEAALQAEEATSKGQADFALSMQESLQAEMPSTVHFEFEERDDQGELLAAQVKQAKADVNKTLSELQANGVDALTLEELRQLLAEDGLIPDDWTIAEEDVTATDEESTERQRLRELPQVRRACEMYPGEPIIRYTWDGVEGREVVLWDSGEEALRRRSFPVLFVGTGWKLTEKDLI